MKKIIVHVIVIVHVIIELRLKITGSYNWEPYRLAAKQSKHHYFSLIWV